MRVISSMTTLLTLTLAATIAAASTLGTSDVERLRSARLARPEALFQDSARSVVLLENFHVRESADSTVVVHEKVIAFGADDAEEFLTSVQDFTADVDIVEATVTRFDLEEPRTESATVVRSESRTGTSSVTFAIPRMDWPAVVLVRLVIGFEGARGWAQRPLLGKAPVVESRIRVETATKTPVELILRNVEADEEIDASTAERIDRTLVFRGLPAHLGHPYLPPPHVHEPTVFLVRHGLEGLLGEAARPALAGARGWNLIALYTSWITRELDLSRFTLADQAHAIVAGAPTTILRQDALFRHVRDRITRISLMERMMREAMTDSADKNWLRDLLASGVATETEKAYLLIALMRVFEFDAQIMWTSEDWDGQYEIEIPSHYQFSEAVVRVQDEGGVRWYDPGCDVCVPGEVRQDLQGRRGFFVPLEAQTRLATTLRAAGSIDMLAMRLGTDEFAQWIELPSSTSEGPSCVEELDVDWRGETASVELRGRGDVSVRRGYRASGSASAVLESALDAVLGIADLESVAPISRPDADRLLLRAQLRTNQLPAATASVWVLPSETLFQTCPWSEWNADRDEPFLMSASSRQVVRHILPLPRGWTGAQLPEDFERAVGPIRYSLRFRNEAGAIVVERVVESRFARIDRLDHKSAVSAAMIEICTRDREALVFEAIRQEK